METEGDLRKWWLRLIEGMGSGSALFRRGLDQRFDAELHPELAAKLVELRPKMQQAIADAGLERTVFRFLPDLRKAGIADEVIALLPGEVEQAYLNGWRDAGAAAVLVQLYSGTRQSP